jgi:polar amino acid transport system substrate-binding protein
MELLFDLSTHVARAIQGIALHRQLRGDSEFNERLLEHMSTGVITIGTDQRVSSMNRRAADILQLDVAAIVGQDLRALPSPLGDLLHETLMTGRARPAAEIQLAFRGLWLELSTYPVDGTHAKGAALVFDDLTAQKELAVQKLQAEQLELLTRVVARVADEIKNPLVSINTFIELIGERFDDADFRQQFSSVVGRDVRRLVQGLEKLSGLVTLGELHFTTVEVHSVVDDAVATVTANDETSSEAIQVQVTREEVPLSVKVDPGQLRKALGYLMWYLARHSQGRPSLLITVGRQADGTRSDTVRVVVASRTADVPVRELEGLFDPVRMVQEDLIDIGPAVSQRIVETLGGSLSMRRSRHEIGFVVRLPLAL